MKRWLWLAAVVSILAACGSAPVAPEQKAPPSSAPGNTQQVQESAAHGATQTTEEKGNKK